MNSKILVVAVMVILLFGAAGVVAIVGSNSDNSRAAASFVLSSSSVPGEFKRALPPAEIEFPRDFGPHPDFQTEWWYYTGNLASVDGRQFGYQLTIFRRALLPPDLTADRVSDLATSQVYLGHFALTDVQAQEHIAYERFARGAAGIAGAQAAPYRVWLEDWQINEIEPGSYRMQAAQDGYAIDLTLIDLKGPVLQGQNGYSQKGPDPGNASYYYSQTRLATNGTIRIENRDFDVTGYSWKDHEYSTSALSGDQVGWDWFAIQFSDQTELKVFHIRLANGQIDRFSSGSFVDQNGNITPLEGQDFSILSSGSWSSDISGATYPANWSIQVPEFNISIQVSPLISDQELNVSYSYWEGAVAVYGTRNGRPVEGFGYAELTGYAQSMAGEF